MIGKFLTFCHRTYWYASRTAFLRVHECTHSTPETRARHPATLTTMTMTLENLDANRTQHTPHHLLHTCRRVTLCHNTPRSILIAYAYMSIIRCAHSRLIAEFLHIRARFSTDLGHILKGRLKRTPRRHSSHAERSNQYSADSHCSNGVPTSPSTSSGAKPTRRGSPPAMGNGRVHTTQCYKITKNGGTLRLPTKGTHPRAARMTGTPPSPRRLTRAPRNIRS